MEKDFQRAGWSHLCNLGMQEFAAEWRELADEVAKAEGKQK